MPAITTILAATDTPSLPCEVMQCNRGFWLDITDCSCKCLPETCGPQQVWIQEDCSCHCMDPGTCPENAEWCFDTCRCKCKICGVCNEGFYWDTDDCTCKCTPHPETCNSIDHPTEPQVWNSDTCSCECASKECESVNDIEMFWDIESCTCKCKPQECPMRIWDPVSC